MAQAKNHKKTTSQKSTTKSASSKQACASCDRNTLLIVLFVIIIIAVLIGFFCLANPTSTGSVGLEDAFASAGKVKDPATNLYKMQDMSNSICNSVTKQEETDFKLVDARDGSIYTVSKLKDNQCWMTSNLKLTNYTLTPADSDLISGSFTLPVSNENWTSTSSAPMVEYQTTYTTDGHGDGAHYNYYAASAGSVAGSQQNATSSICPKGWTLPTGGPNGQFLSLANAYNYRTPSTVAAINLRKSPADFTLSGYHDYSGTLVSDRGTGGDWWSATASDAEHQYGMAMDLSNLNPTYSNTKTGGNSVRCLAR